MDQSNETPVETPVNVPAEKPVETPVVVAAEVEEEEEETYHQPEWVLRVALAASILSWIIGLLFLIYPTSQIYMQIKSYTDQGGMLSAITWDQWYGLLGEVFSTVLQGLGLAVVLQGVSHGLNLLLDIYEDLQTKK